jgi:hypothetical protein
MKRTYKLIASRGTEIVFDDRLQADTPRDARKELKRLLGLQSLSGIVYSITEIPVDLIREIVDARIAEIAGGDPLDIILPADIKEAVMEHLTPILRRLTAPEPPTHTNPLVPIPTLDWNLVKRHFRRYRNPLATAAKYGINLTELNARANREGWAA